jgi:hypothetical protein
VLAAMILALTACSSGSAQQQEAKPRTLPEEGKALSPGEYRSGEFKPSLTFSIGKGWSLFDVDESDAFALSNPEQTRWVGFTNVKVSLQAHREGHPNGRVKRSEGSRGSGWLVPRPPLPSNF